MATMHSLFLSFLSIAVCVFVGIGDRDLAADSRSQVVYLFQNKRVSSSDLLRVKIMHIAEMELGVRELTGNNDGDRVEAYLRYTQIGKGHAWCAAFVSWCYAQAGKSTPRNAWSPALFPKARQYRLERTREAVPALADVFGIYSAAAKRINHVGLVNGSDGSYILTVEGNVDNRVQAKRRLKTSIYIFANWLDHH